MNITQLGVNTASLAGLSLDDALTAAARMRFASVELLAFDGMEHRAGQLAGFWFSELPQARRKRILRLLEPFDRRAVHLPFADERPLSYNRRIAQLSVKLIEEGIRGARYFGASTAVIHLNPPTNTGWPTLGGHRGRAIDFLRRLADYAAKRGVRLGMETMYPPSFRDFASLVHETDHPALGATLDVGHVVQAAELGPLRRPRPTRRFITRLNEIECELTKLLGPKLFHAHLHGLDPVTLRDHCMPDTGVLDFARIFSAFGNVNYDGMLSLELEVLPARQAVRKSRKFFAKLLDRAPVKRNGS